MRPRDMPQTAAKPSQRPGERQLAPNLSFDLRQISSLSKVTRQQSAPQHPAPGDNLRTGRSRTAGFPRSARRPHVVITPWAALHHSASRAGAHPAEDRRESTSSGRPVSSRGAAYVHERGAKQRAPRGKRGRSAEPEYLGDRDRSFAAICLSRVYMYFSTVPTATAHPLTAFRALASALWQSSP